MCMCTLMSMLVLGMQSTSENQTLYIEDVSNQYRIHHMHMYMYVHILKQFVSITKKNHLNNFWCIHKMFLP